MKRRSFLKTATAAIATTLLPSFVIAKPKRLPIDLMKFCDDQSSRYDLTRPFLQGDWTYATDARICIRIPDIVRADEDEDRRLPKADKLWWEHATLDQWQPFPREQLVIRKEGSSEMCLVCKWKGRVGSGVVLCPRCDGEQWTFDDEGHEMRCGLCTSGYIGGERCDYCDGKGSTLRPTHQRVGDVLVQGHYARLVRDLPGVEFAIRPMATAHHGICGVVAFRAHGAEGLLMPVCEE